MDYNLTVFPSSEKDLQNIKVINKAKTIKIVQEGKLPLLYKKSFGPAVKAHDERAISGRLIEDYYKSILNSNIPEVYKLSLVIRYELFNKNELAIIQKTFMDFKKLLEQESYLSIVSVYIMSFDEFKELQIFFYPVTDGYVTGLSVRNDIIDLTKKLTDTKENINIMKAMPMFTEHMCNLFDQINQGQFMSQEELEAEAKHLKEQDPFSLHAIAVETLKSQMNELQKLTMENQRLENAVEDEKKRIAYDIEWSKETENAIYHAEKERIEEEKRREAAARKAEAERRAYEAQKREEERLKEEARKIEAERLAEQARRNIELRKEMELQEKLEQERRSRRKLIDADSFARLLEQHLRWQDAYEIGETTEFDKLPEHVLKDARRLIITSADIKNAEFDKSLFLFGVKFADCTFEDCRLTVQLMSSTLEKCNFIDSDLSEIQIKKCSLSGLNLDRLVLDNAEVHDSTIMQSSFNMTTFASLMAAPATSFIQCNFTNAEFEQCDMKKNAFVNCDFTNTRFVASDLRDSAFQICNLDTMTKEGSLFRGVKISQN